MSETYSCETVCGELEQESGGWIANAPWWMLSAGVHVVVLLIATLVYIERMVALDEGTVIVSMGSEPTTKIDKIDRPTSPFEQTGIPTDEVSNTPVQDAAIWNPCAELSDHSESKDNEDHQQMKGNSMKFISYQWGAQGGIRGTLRSNKQGSDDTLGVGGGNGDPGRHGGPLGGRRDLRARISGTRLDASDSAVLAALRWLARHQNENGPWNAENFADRCVASRCSGPGSADHDIGVTGLALLAFLGSGFTPMSRDEFPDPVQNGKVLKFGMVVKKGLQWLMARQDQAGCFGERGPRYMYGHAIATLALCEAFGMTGSLNLRESAQRGVDFLVASQNPGKGWRYTERSGDNDSSVTGWCVMALKSADISELAFPKSCYANALAWYDEVTERGGYYRVGYADSRVDGKVVEPDKNEKFEGHPAMAAVAVMSRIFMKKDRHDPMLGAVQLLIDDLPKWKPNGIDYYYWYYASLALFQYDGPDGPRWKKWNEALKTSLVPSQRSSKDGCLWGSWDPEVDRWGFAGGRVYATAINALTLEVYYRYANVFGGARK